MAVRIMESLSRPFALGRGEASVSASIGVTVLDEIAEREAEELVWEADQAMYRAKGREGRATRSPKAGDPRSGPIYQRGGVGPMARAGERIYNPVQGDWIEFRQTAQDTGGELMSGELVVSPRGGNPLHVHPLQEEHFEVLSGTLGVQIGDEQRSLGEEEEATVPPGTPHRWFNESDDEEAHVLVELRPALNTETFFETLYGLARDGRTGENGAPNILQQAVTFNGINKGEIYLAWPPVAVQKALLAALAPVGRLLGYKDHYPRYSAEHGTGGAEPPSTASVMARGAALVGGLVVASTFLIGKMRHRSKL